MEYDICADQHGLTYVNKCKLIVNVLKGTAKWCYLSVKLQVNLESLISMMKRKYDSEAQRNQVQAKHESLGLSAFMSSRNIMSENQGLMQMINHLNFLHPQVLQVFQFDAIKLRYLRHALFSCSRAHTSLNKINGEGMMFARMASALRCDLQFHLEQQAKNSLLHSTSFAT